MKKAIIKGCIFAVTFLAALIVSSVLLNKGNTDMTAEIGNSELPLVFLDVNGRNVNMMRGYLADMDEKYMHADILPIDAERKVSIRIKSYGAVVDSVSFAVRSIDGERLVEETAVTDLNWSGSDILADIVLKDLIEKDKEYNLVLQVKLEDGREAAYYTRVIQTEDWGLQEKLDFVEWFSRMALEEDDLQELKTYMESNSEGDNTSLSKVTIHSSLSQLGWGELDVEQRTEPVYNILDITKETVSVAVEYLVKYQRYERDAYASVREIFRLKTGTERMYLMDYERTMNEVFSEEAGAFLDDKVVLGILDPELEMAESDGGKILAFEQSGVLYSLNTTDYKLSRLFSVYDQNMMDERVIPGNSDFKILKIDETGNVYFLLVGYIPRGRYEGYCGIDVFYYNSSTNTIEELAFLPSAKAPDVLAAEMEVLSGLNGQNELYILLNNMLCCIDLETQRLEVLAENLNQDTCRVAESNRNIVWQNDADEYNCRSLTLMNLNSGKETIIEADSGCVVYPLGFMGEDLVYGVARISDISVNHAGKSVFPMYQVRIQNENGETLMIYEKAGIYVTGCRMKENQIVLERVQRNNSGEYIVCQEDQIVSGIAADERINRTTSLSTAEYQKLTAIQLKRSMESKKMKFLTPREVLYEGSREVEVPVTESLLTTYYVYGSDGEVAILSDPGEAVNLAYEEAGVVVDQKGNYVWRKEKQNVRNQIMAIEGVAADEGTEALAVCLDVILAYEGVTRSTQSMLSRGSTVSEILEESLPGVQVLDLEDCSMASILYYPDHEIPVLATLEDGNAVLIIGFNEQNIVIMNPENGQVYKVGMNDATEWFEENGNMFLTYLKGIS